MKKILLMAAIFMMTATSMNGQRIQVVDNDAHGIPLVSVLSEDGTIIGTTDLDGVLADVRGNRKVALTHVAYKPQLVTVASLADGRITMESIDYNLDEIVVKPKPYIYIETYYRIYVYRNDSLGYFASGIMPNVYDPKAKKFEHGSYNQNCVEYYSSFGSSITWGARAQINRAGQVRAGAVIGKKLLKDKYFVTTDESDPMHLVYSNPEGKVGQMIRNGSQAHSTFDAGSMQMYVNKVKGETKMLKKREEMGYKYRYTLIGKYDEEGNENDITGFVMNTDHWEFANKKGPVKYIIECYATDRGYMDKNEWKAKKKELKKEHKGASALSDLSAYERQHNIPELPATVRQAVGKLKHL